jgi:hypothetical protein
LKAEGMHSWSEAQITGVSTALVPAKLSWSDQQTRSSAGSTGCDTRLEGAGDSPRVGTSGRLDAQSARDVATGANSINKSSREGGGSSRRKAGDDTGHAAFARVNPNFHKQPCVLRLPTAKAATAEAAAAFVAGQSGQQLPPRHPQPHSRGPSWSGQEVSINLGLSPRSNDGNKGDSDDCSSFWGHRSAGLECPVLPWSPPFSPSGNRASVTGAKSGCCSRSEQDGFHRGGGDRGERVLAIDEETVVASLDGTWLQAGSSRGKGCSRGKCSRAAVARQGSEAHDQQQQGTSHRSSGDGNVDNTSSLPCSMESVEMSDLIANQRGQECVEAGDLDGMAAADIGQPQTGGPGRYLLAYKGSRSLCFPI